MPAGDEEQYVELGRDRLLDLARAETAFTVAEAEAKLADVPGDDRRRVDPHHLTTARRQLTEFGLLDSETARSYGEQEIEVHFSTEATATAVKAAVSRKRAASARFTGWATGNQRHPSGLMGPAAERATNTALRDAAADAGYRPAASSKRGVERLFGADVPGGPLDAAAFHIPVVDDRPGRAITLLVEVKNLRSWIYPTASELYQLLHKPEFRSWRAEVGTLEGECAGHRVAWTR